MALTAILRRSASTAAPLAAKIIGKSQRYNHHGAALFSAVNHSGLARKISPNNLFPSINHYSSSASSALKRPSSDDSLIRVIESEIELAEEAVDNEVQEIPEGFPFEIEDNPGQQTVSLSREYQGESINIEVAASSLVTGDDDHEDSQDDDDTERSSQSNIPMVVRVSKKDGPCLEFGVTAFPDEIVIDSLSVKDPETSDDQLPYDGPSFDDLDENLQKAFHKYLEIRGIKPSVTNFLHEYMVDKEQKEYTNWLKNLKKFIEA